MRIPVSILAAAVLVWPVLAGGGHPADAAAALRLTDVSVSRIAVVGDSYTTGSDEGGRDANGWLARTGWLLGAAGKPAETAVAAEGGAGYGVRGNHGSLFADLATRVVAPDEALVVFFGSRNDDVADPNLLAGHIRDALGVARRSAPNARLLVIGPPWPTAPPPEAVLRVRDILLAESVAAQAEFIDPLAEGWFVGRPDLIGGDGVHPNDAGHVWLAERIEPLISARLPA